MMGLGKPRHLFIPTPKICKKCKKTMKNPKNYVLLNQKKLGNGFWTIVKQCKRCGYKNVNREKPTR